MQQARWLALIVVPAVCSLAGPGRAAPTPLAGGRVLPASQIVAPPPPRVAPVVHPLTSIDQDGNRVDDLIDAALRQAHRSLSSAQATPAQRAAAQTLLDEPISVEFNFTRPITQAELDAFTRLGGQVTWIYNAVGYGWNGIIPRGQVPTAVAQMAGGFNAAVQAVSAHPDMYNATRNGRVRGEWGLGYTGASDTTIAILDTGISGSHTDLAGRQRFWHDYTSDAAATPRDMGEHGSHVAGIALGTGASAGANPTTIPYSDSSAFACGSSLGYFWLAPIEVPTPTGGTGTASVTWTGDATWGPTDGVRAPILYFFVYQPKDNPFTTGNDVGYYWLSSTADNTGHSNVSTTFSVPFSGTAGTSKINSSIFMTGYAGAPSTADFGTDSAPSVRYAVANTLTAQNGASFSAGDNYNLLSGVAPGCQWAGFKVFTDAGTGSSLDIEAALDDLAQKASTYNIKVANMSLGINNSLQSTRDKTNAAVNAGVFIAVSEGNSGPNGSPTDPARAGLAMTVAASTNTNQLTDYTTNGFTGGTDFGGDTIKPDIMAPGGSPYTGYMLSVDSNDDDAETPDFPDARPNDYRLMMGTSMASPFVAGCAALVIDAWKQAGHTWQFGSSADPLFVKMLLCATATESNQPRSVNPAAGGTGVNNPNLGRAAFPKDGAEGYGMINVDAAIECLRRAPLTDAPVSEALGSGRFDKRASGFSLPLSANGPLQLSLAVPIGADYDLYLYRPTPDVKGNPVIVAASTTATTGGNTESLAYTPTADGTYYAVVKRVSGSGAFTLSATLPYSLADAIRALKVAGGLLDAPAGRARLDVVQDGASAGIVDMSDAIRLARLATGIG